VLESDAFPPDVPNLIGIACACWFGFEATICTLADEDFVASACDTAVTEIVAGLGTCAGAVSTPAAEIVPSEEFPPSIPLTSHVTSVFVDPVTLA